MSELSPAEIIGLIESATSKKALEALGVKHFGVDVDKRKNIDVIRAELLGLADEKFGVIESAEPEVKETTEQVSKEEDPKPEPKANVPMAEPAKQRTMRMGRNKKTGRLMPWTAAMAKMDHMELVE